MIEVIGVLVGLWLLRYLVYLPFLTGRTQLKVRWRIPLRHRYPRLWRALVVFGVLVVAPVGLLASACDWWGL